MLKEDELSRDMTGAVKFVLLSLDRNLRLRARLRQLPAASEKDLAIILATGLEVVVNSYQIHVIAPLVL